MKKIKYKYFFFLLISLPALSQVKKLSAKDNLQASAKTFVSSSATETPHKSNFAPTSVNIEILPFFGNFDKNENQKQKDDAFLKSCEANFSNREDASKFFSARAWEYLNEGQADTATYRFNLAWLLNQKNVDVFWGLGVIAYQKENLHDAINFMENGHKIDDKNTTLSIDLATVKIQCYLKDKDSTDLERANKLLAETINLEPANANAYMKLSLLKLVEGFYNDAWANFHQGYELDMNSLDIDLLTTLLEKQADPKGRFR